QHVEAVDPRQHDVEQHEIERLAGGAGEAALAIAAVLDGVAFAGEAIGEGHDEPGLVLDEQQALHAGELRRAPTRGSIACGSGASTAAGRTTVKALPCAGALLTSIRPPCTSTIRRTRLRPRPAPWICAATTSGAR